MPAKVARVRDDAITVFPWAADADPRLCHRRPGQVKKALKYPSIPARGTVGGMVTGRARVQLRQLGVVMLFVCTITPVFNLLTDELSVRAAVQGLVDGVIIPVLVMGYLGFLRDGRLRVWFRRLGFWTDVALSSTIVLALFLLGRGLGQVV